MSVKSTKPSQDTDKAAGIVARSKKIEDAMSHAITDAHKYGITEPKEVRKKAAKE